MSNIFKIYYISFYYKLIEDKFDGYKYGYNLDY